MFLLRIRKVLGSHFDLETGYRIDNLHDFSKSFDWLIDLLQQEIT